MKKKNYLMLEDDYEMEMEESVTMQGGIPMILAHSYVPWQYYDKAFSPQEALIKGTLFPELWGVYPIPD